MLLFFILLLSLFHLATYFSFVLLMYSFNMSLSFMFLILLCFFGTTRPSRLILYFPCPRVTIGPFSSEPWFLLLVGYLFINYYRLNICVPTNLYVESKCSIFGCRPIGVWLGHEHGTLTEETPASSLSLPWC